MDTLVSARLNGIMGPHVAEPRLIDILQGPLVFVYDPEHIHENPTQSLWREWIFLPFLFHIAALERRVSTLLVPQQANVCKTDCFYFQRVSFSEKFQ